MFFIASKIFWVLIKPLNFLCVLCAAGFLTGLKFKKTGRVCIGLAVTLFLIFGLLPVGPNMLTYLERQYERPQIDNLPDRIDGIIVLGGAFDPEMSAYHGYIVAGSASERVHDFMILGRRYPKAKLVFSGGSGRPLQQDYKEADYVSLFFKDLGQDQSQLIVEPNSRNTYQNAKFSHDLVKPQKEENWILITSAFHMPRSMGIFDALNWDVIPYPTDHMTDLRYKPFPDQLNVSSNFHFLEISLKEIIGTMIYGITGKSSLMFPQKIVGSETS